MKYRLRTGWHAEVITDIEQGYCEIMVSVARPGRAAHVIGVYHLALSTGQQPIEALFSACPQAFDLDGGESLTS